MRILQNWTYPTGFCTFGNDFQTHFSIRSKSKKLHFLISFLISKNSWCFFPTVCIYGMKTVSKKYQELFQILKEIKKSIFFEIGFS